MPNTMTYPEYCDMVRAEVMREMAGADAVVVKGIKYRRFVSRTKGWRNGKQRLRRNWKETHLVKYSNGFHLWHNFPFDIYATEILGAAFDGEDLRQRIIDLWGY